MNKLKKITYRIQNISVFFITSAIFPFMSEKLGDVAFSVGLLALLIRCVKLHMEPDFLKLKSWWPLIGMLVYIVVLIGVSQFSSDVRKSSHVAYNYFKYMKISFEILILMNGWQSFYRAFFSGLAIGTIGICFGKDNMIYQYFHNEMHYQYDMHRNMIADIFILMIPCTILYLFHYAKYRIEKILSIILLGLCCFTLYCTESRGAVLSLLILGLVFSLWYCIHQGISKYKILIGSIIILITLIIGFAFIPQNNHLTNLQDAVKFESTPLESYSERHRIYLYEGTWNMIKEHPVFGVGLDNFNKEYVAHYMVKNAVEKDLPHAHNFILAILSTTGIIGLIGFFFMEWQFVRFFFKRRYNINAIIGMFCLLVILLHDLVDYSLSVYLVCKLYWLILVFCCCAISMEEDSH